MEDIQPKDDRDTETLSLLFDNFSDALNTTMAGGNDMAVVRLIGSALSYFENDNTQTSSNSVQVEVFLFLFL